MRPLSDEETEAFAYVKNNREKHPDIHMESVVLSGQDVWYRIMIGNFESTDDARRYMKEKKVSDAHPGSFVQLKSAGQSSGMQNP
jgi:hypothetical protein